MAHAIHINFGKHSDFSHHSHPGGWWKFGAFAVTATAVGALVVHSVWSTGASSVPVIPDGIKIEVASQPLPPVTSNLAPSVAPLPPLAINPNAPAVAPLVPPAAPATAAESDTPATTEDIQKSSQTPAASQAPVINPAPVVNSAPPAAPQTVSQTSVTPAANIHAVDFSAVAPLQSLAQQLNGSVNSAGVQYHDLTGDGVDEAIVPITSGGTQGDLGFVVMTESNGAPSVLFTQKADRSHQGLVVSFVGSQLTVTSAAYGPNDANCCPSQITRTFYHWNGDTMVVDHADTIVVPQGKDAD